MSRNLNQTVHGPDPLTVVAVLEPDNGPEIEGVIDPSGTAHFAFTVPDEITGGAWREFSAEGWETFRDRIGWNPDGTETGMPSGDFELEAISMVAEEAPAPPTHAHAGIVLTNRKVMYDAFGPWNPLGFTMFWFFQAWRRSEAERDRAKKNVVWMRPYVDHVRPLFEVGTDGNTASSWTGNTIEPKTPYWSNYQEVIRDGMDWLWNDQGLRTEVTVMGKGSGTDPLWLSERVTEVLVERPHQVLGVEMVNEFSSGVKISIETMKAMAAIFKAKIPNILALSNPGNGAERKALEAAANSLGLTGCTEHLRRKCIDNCWSQPRQGIDFRDTKRSGRHNEPAGPGSSAEVQTDPIKLALTRAIGVMCGGASYTNHAGTLVYGDGKSHQTAGPRPANVWEIPNYAAMLTAVREVGRLLPSGIANWAAKNTQRAGVPFDLPRSMHWGTGNIGSSGWGVNKAYASVSPSGEFLQIPIGVKTDAAHPCRLTAKFNMKNVTMYDAYRLPDIVPVPGIEDRSFAAGETLDLLGNVDGEAAYVISGQRA